MYKTTDGGLNWISFIPLDDQGIFTSINNVQDIVTTENHIFICHQIVDRFPYSLSKIDKTTNIIKSIGLIGSQGMLSILSVNTRKPKVLLTGGYHLDQYEYQGCLFKSEDGGLSWYNVFDPKNNANVYAASSNDIDDNIIIIGSENGVFRSLNNGNNWQQITQDVCRSVCISQYGHIFAVSSNKLLLSSDDGINWEEIYNENPLKYNDNCLKIDEKNHLLYVSSSNGLTSFRIKY